MTRQRGSSRCRALVRVFAWIAALAVPASAAERPNILMLFADDMTYRALGAIGPTDVRTPNLDRLAARGTTFTHAFVQGGTSGAVCVASRAMLMTGRTLWSCGKNGDCTRDGVNAYPMWGRVLADAGYRTFAVGKWHNGRKTLEAGFQTARPVFLGGMLESTPESGPAYRRPAPGNPWTPDDSKWKGQWMSVGGGTVHSSEHWADAAIQHLEAASEAEAPSFLYVAFTAPHDPRQSPTRDLERYPAESMTLPPNFLPKHPFDLGEFQTRDEILAPYPRTEAIVKMHLREYAAIISHLDAQIGRILEALDRSSRRDRTIVIFAADNGLAVGQHGLLGKQSLYEHSVRVPLVVAGPGIPARRRIDAMVYIGSLFATTCELAGVSIPDTVQFPSLVPLVTGKKERLYDDLYGGYVKIQRMVRTDRWKLTITPRARMVQLFEIEEDPWEMHDRARDPDKAVVIDDLFGRLKRWMKELDDPLPVETLEQTLADFRRRN